MSKNNVYRDKQRQTKTCTRKKGAKDAEQKQRKTYKDICKTRRDHKTQGRAKNEKRKGKKTRGEGWLVVHSKKVKEHRGC